MVMSLLRSLILLLVVAGCGGGAGGAECLALPCPLPLAISLTVSSATSGVGISGATVEVTGAEVTTFPCNVSCPVLGPPGNYEITVSAPGFVSVHRSVQVHGTSPKCSCATTDPESVTVGLSPSSSTAMAD